MIVLQPLSLKNNISKNSLLIIILPFFFFGCEGDYTASNGIYKCDTIINKEYYEICYNYELKGAKFVSYTLDGSLVFKNNIEKRVSFYQEKELPLQYRSDSNDYIGSGYDRGHLASDASFDYSQKSLYSVYTMANIIPQEHDINRDYWIDTEYEERKKAKQFGMIKVLIGVVYDDNPKRIGENEIAVPNGFYKMLSNAKQHYKKCYFYENIPQYSTNNNSLTSHEVDCSTLLLEYK